MFPRSIFSIRIITTILAISIIINNINIIINNRVSSQPCGLMFCCRKRNRAPLLAAGAARPRAWRLKVSVVQFDLDGVEEDVTEVLPWAYGPSTESLHEWLDWLHTDMVFWDTADLDSDSHWFLDYETEPMY